MFKHSFKQIMTKSAALFLGVSLLAACSPAAPATTSGSTTAGTSAGTST